MPVSDFDLCAHYTRIRHGRLEKRLAGCDLWWYFESTYAFHKILDGRGNTDTLTAEIEGRYFEGMSLRLHAAAADRWTIYWVDSNGMRLEPPVVGSFEHGVGTFFGVDEHQGREVKVRYTWKDMTETTARWEQAWSIDDGASWETNAVMDFFAE